MQPNFGSQLYSKKKRLPTSAQMTILLWGDGLSRVMYGNTKIYKWNCINDIFGYPFTLKNSNYISSSFEWNICWTCVCFLQGILEAPLLKPCCQTLPMHLTAFLSFSSLGYFVQTETGDSWMGSTRRRRRDALWLLRSRIAFTQSGVAEKRGQDLHLRPWPFGRVCQPHHDWSHVRCKSIFDINP